MNEQYKDIEGLSIETAKRIQVPFDEDAWNKMEDLLNQDETKSPIVKDKLWYQNFRNFTILLLCTIFAIYALSSISNANAFLLNQKHFAFNYNLEKHFNPSILKNNYQNNTIRNENLVTDKTIVTPIAIKNTFFEGNIKTSIENNLAINEQKKLYKAKSVLSKKSSAIKEKFVTQKPLQQKDLAYQNKAMGEDENIIKDRSVSNIEEKVMDKIIENKKNIIQDSTNQPLLKKMSNENLSKNKIADQKIKKNKNSFANKFYFSIISSPEINIVTFDKKDITTLNYGIGLNYNLNKHFTLQTQFIRANKIYTTDKKGYKATNVFPYYQNLDTVKVNAYCKMIDMPINVKYSFNKNTSNSFYISAGVTSYFVKKERYDYSYNYLGTYRVKQNEYKNSGKQLFANINFSAGYQHQIGKNTFLNIEPYIKVPLQGIGTGNVKLTSIGTAFSLNFKPF